MEHLAHHAPGKLETTGLMVERGSISNDRMCAIASRIFIQNYKPTPLGDDVDSVL